MPESQLLSAAIAGVGMNLSVRPAHDPNIEDTLLFAAELSMEHDDLRVLALLVTWFGVHSAYVNADRLTKSVQSHASRRVRTLFAALAKWQSSDRRFARLARLHRGTRVDLLSTGSDFQIRRHGEDERFAQGPLRVPANVLRDREADVLSPERLAGRHPTYRMRVTIGPSYRADMWAALESDPSLTASALARRTYGSFATAWAVKRDFSISAIHRSESRDPSSR